MTIGPEIRAMPALGDKGIAAPAEGASLIEMFADIISGLSAAPAAGAPARDPSILPIQEGEVAAPEAAPDAAADLVQLLAITAGQQGKARVRVAGAEADEEPGDTTPAAQQEAPLPQIAPVASPTVQPQPVVVPVPVPVPVQAAPAPQAAQAAEHPLPVRAKTAPASGQGSPKSKPAPAVISAPPVGDQPDEETSDTQPLASRGIADLLKSVARPILLPHARDVAPNPLPQDRARGPAASPLEVKHPALAQPPIAHAQIASILVEATAPAEPLSAGIDAAPQADAADLAVERQLDFAQEGEWLDSLAKDIARTAAGEGGTLRFRLNPENLGSLRVEITQQANGSAVRLTADTDTARAVIAEAQPRLIAEARANGVRISETHVDLGGQGTSGDPRRQNAASEETPVRTARFLRDAESSDGKPTRSQSERYA